MINENSRQGREMSDAAVEVLERGGLQLQRATSDGPGDLVDTIRQAAGTVDLVVLGGGDGTLSSAAPALIETGLPLGILPLGTANDLAHTLGIPLDIGDAAQVIVEGKLRRIDLGEVNGKPFFNVASLGLSVAMTRELTHDVKQRWGRLGYAVSTFRALTQMRPFVAEIRAGDEVHRVRTLQIAVGNGRYYGAGMAVEKDAEIDDSCLNLYSLEFGHLWKLALVYPAFRKGRHGLWKEVRTMRCREVDIRTARPKKINTDGEITTETPAQFRVLPRAVSVFAPAADETRA
ncbi:Transcription regulator (contains diacylglycerol kinase catalytic domain protein) [Rubellimicrobium mesophilum DSM 19309]|uniref:Transcription regulator (Contains diacylglycerol kinase catalytic domain protein) n=1 Tax=Rubellimicrobium mesophilum DSM 19309 TaxID=442562 RepID=A0A017HAI1_9RHOB|nr:Transcription regulator (contains diacylglycerol kinase catalytic domain protein) [Rubellimicrobium mesophilum DSM 19309]